MPSTPHLSTRARVLTGAGATATTLAATASPAMAHGLGEGRLDVPLWSVLYGSVVVLIITFAALAWFWKEPRIEGQDGGRVLPGGFLTAGRALVAVGRVLGPALLVLLVFSAARGSDLPSHVIFIAVWVVVPVLSALLGDLWYAINPFEAVRSLLEQTDAGEEPEWLERVGVYPAAVMLLGFGWLELVHPHAADPQVMLGVLVFYTGVMVVGGLAWGPGWIRAADAFGVYFGYVGRMGIFQRDRDGRARLRAPLAGLADLVPRRGTAMVVLVALGVTSFDGLKGTQFWEQSVLGTRVNWASVPFDTVGIIVMVALVTLAYDASIRSAAGFTTTPKAQLVEDFAHSLVPIALGYAVAHYVGLVLFNGQTLLALASDPLRLDWDLFGTADNRIDFALLSDGVIASLQVGGILLGHLAGVLLAHDRAVARFEPDVATKSQHALLAAMVLYTVGGLVLLLGG